MMEDEVSQTKLFSKIWPTSETFEYFPYLDEISYCEKLMGKHARNNTFLLVKHCFADAFEYYYGDHRDEGRELINQYCDMKTHLKVKVEHPKHEDQEQPQQQLPKISIPSVFLTGE